MVRRELKTLSSSGQAAPRRTWARGAVRLRVVALIPLLLVVLGAVLSCTDILGIDTDYGTNPCNTEKASGLAPIECHQGACHALIDACDGLGLPASCPPFEPQEKDLCNDGFDNDCDGYTDEDECPCEDLDEDGQPNSKSCYTGSPATRGVGACQDGIQYCQNNVWNQCTEAVLPTQEKCDNLDNDCDGNVDEGCPCNDGLQQPCYRGPESTLGVGECSSGTQTCIDGAWGECVNDKTPKLELCDGVDNDCNGVVDVDSDSCECVEGEQEDCYTGPPNTLIEGAACRMGLRTCVGGKFNDASECEGEVVPSPEICDGLDNDCNGVADEGIPDIGLDCSSMFPGDCLPGKYICTMNGLYCQPNVQPGDHVETCNGENDDCDAETDEGPFCCDSDTVQSGNETDVNCGGDCPTKCQNGQACLVDADCESNSCANDTCVPPECTDGSINGDETDIDCGGATGCPRCTVGDLCDVDSDCITNRCDPNAQGINQCAPKDPGEPCLNAGECASNYCVDGFCCNSQCNGTCQACSAQKKGNGGADGVCESIVDGADPDNECNLESPSTCGSTGVCNGFGVCRLYPPVTICNQPSCSGSTASNTADYCNGLGVCVDSGVLSCGTYACNAATGNCFNNCSSDTQCAGDAYCSNGACVSKLPTGQFCSTTNECQSGFCVDGFCCSSACANACDVCSAQLGAAANGTCTNAAGYAGNPACDGHLCSAAQPTCPSLCTSNAGCAATHYCDANSNDCVPKLSNGADCAAASQCQSGNCVDGFCCNSACGGACNVCSAALGASANGTCTNAQGYAGNPSCGNYVCSGASQNCPLSCTNDSVCAVGTYCSSATNTCVDKLVTGSSCQSSNQCDSGNCVDGFCCNSACTGNCNVCSAALGAQANGICTNAAGYVGNPPCNGFVCTGTSELCPGACTNDGQCNAGYYCSSSNTCVLKQTIGQACSTNNQCDSNFCVDGYCCTNDCAGSCNVCAAALGASANGTCTNITGAGIPSCAPFACTGASGACPNTCTVDTECVSGRYCSGGACLSKLSDGVQCSAANQCQSGNCVDGVCCNTACTGQCNVCTAALGGPADGVCANVAGYAGSPSCAPYVCSSGSSVCPLICASDGQCTSGYYCNAPSCEAKRGLGQSCSAANQCQSGNCVDGVCCDSACSGSCDVCSAALGAPANGTCANIVGAGNPSCAPYACTGLGGACPAPGTCVSDAYCATGNYCNTSNNCVPKLVTGTACTASNQCQSGNCVDGYCCDGACGGSCNVCAQALGASANGTCTNVAGSGSPSCAPYVCTGGSGICPNTCANDTQCSAGNYCNAVNQCVPKITDGACTAPNQCQSNFCVDGYCCNAACGGACEVCAQSLGASANGVCTPLADGQPGSPSCGAYLCTGASGICPNTCGGDADCTAGNYCNGSGSGTCTAKQANGTACTATSQCVSGNCVNGYCCNQACDGACDVCAQALGASANGACTPLADGLPGAPSCGAYLCNGTLGTCPSTCAGDADCTAGNYCNGSGSGTCVPTQSTGAACTAPSQCASGSCTDGFCCDQACGGSCEVCSQALGASANGTCTLFADGQPGAPSCGAYLCNGASGACPMTCGGDADCTAGNYCNASNQCVPKLAQGGSCTGGNQCSNGNCVNGFCCSSACDGSCDVCAQALGASANGVCTLLAGGAQGSPSCGAFLCDGVSSACPSTCAGDADCSAGNYCNASNLCVPTLAQGGACTAPSQCSNGNCVNGFCCSSACSGGCDVCAQALGASADGVCTPLADGAPGSPLCAPYVCDGTSGGCPSSCAGDADCSSGNYCNGSGSGVCMAQQATGTACTIPSQCSNGNCVNGFCCDSACGGSCDVCAQALGASADGVCTLLVDGEPGSPLCAPYLCNGVSSACPPTCAGDADCSAGNYCDASNQCVPTLAQGEACGAPSECSNGNCVNGFCCSSACSGGCDVCAQALGASADGVCTPLADGAPGSPLCAPYLCDGTSGGCPSSCAGDADCSSGNYCNGSGSGVCVAQQATGTSCTIPSQCSNGNCVDGFCCDSACGGSCDVCAQALGASADGVCTGVDVASNYPGSPSCSPYICGTAGAACPSSCASDANCAAGHWCDDSGACRPPVVLLVGGDQGASMIGGVYHPGGGWSSSGLAAGAMFLGDVAISRAGGVAVTRTSVAASDNMGYATWNPGTDLWSGFTALAGSTSSGPSISATGSAARAAYLVSGTPNTFWSTVHSGGAWGGATATTATSAQSIRGDIAHLADGTAAFVYADAAVLKLAVYDGSSWTSSPPTIDTGTTGSFDIAPSIASMIGGPADLMVVLVDVNGANRRMYSRVRTSGVWSSRLQIGGNGDQTAHQVALTALPGGGAMVAYRGTDTFLYTSVYTPGASPSWSTPTQFLVGGNPVAITHAPALARGANAGPSPAAVELAYIRDGSTDTMHHSRCASVVAGACTGWSPPVQVNTEAVTNIAIASRP